MRFLVVFKENLKSCYQIRLLHNYQITLTFDFPSNTFFNQVAMFRVNIWRKKKQ